MNVFNNDGMRQKDFYKTRVRPCILEDEKGAHCRIRDDAVCYYTQKTLRLQNFLRHFRSMHEKEAREKGLFWDECQDYGGTSSLANDQESGGDYTKNKRWYELLKPCLLEDEKGIHCQIVVGDFLCNYTQKTRRMQNLLRHFRIKHKQEARQMGLFENKPDPSDGDQSQNVTEEQLDEDVGPLKTEVQEGSVDKNSCQRSLKSIHKSKLIPKSHRLMKFVVQDQAGYHCRILDDASCPYTQRTLREHNFLRHFRSAHPSESKQQGFSKKSATTNESDDEQGSDTCVKTEEFNVVERGLAQIDADGGVGCAIEPESGCQYRQDSYDEERFLAHFRLKHSYLEDVLFPGDGATIPDQIEHVEVGEDGIFCAMEPESGCTYFQTSYSERKFRQHFRAKHSGDAEREPAEDQNGLYQQIKQYIYEDDEGTHCRISDVEKCEYVQQKRQLQLFLRHFLLSHRKEAKQKGFLKNPQMKMLESIVPVYDASGRTVIYQSYHLKKLGLVLAQDDGFRCSQESCDFLREKYDESVFLEHLRQNHDQVFGDLQPSKQRLTFKVAEHVLQDGRGFHCRVAGPNACSYVQSCYRMQNLYRHFYMRHREDFDRAGFVLSHANSYGTAKKRDFRAYRDEEEGEAGVSGDEPSESNCDTFLGLELSVEQASGDEEDVARIKHEPEREPKDKIKVLYQSYHLRKEGLVLAQADGFGCSQEPCGFEREKYDESEFLEHLRQHHPSLAAGLKVSNQPLTLKVAEHVLEDGRGFHCRIAGPNTCSYVQNCYRMQNLYRHFYLRHREDFERAGFMLSHEKLRAANSGNVTSVPKITQKQWSAQRAKIEELVTVDDQEAFRCNISENSRCDFVMSNFYHQLFARHFRKNHPEEAKRHGFFDEFLLLKSAYGKPQKPMIGEFVTLDEWGGGFRCNIVRNTHCSYVRQRLLDKDFSKHFRVIHPEEAKRHGFFELARPAPRKRKRIKCMVQLVRENVAADSRGIHCRIADPLCDYVQEIFRPQNFHRHFVGKHPEEARAKGFLGSEPEPERTEAEEEPSQESDCELLANPVEYCRLCSSTTLSLEPIFCDDQNPLVALIEQFTGIALTVESDLSAHICADCHQRLQTSQHFRQQCQTFDRKVRRGKPIAVPFIGVESDEQTLLPLDIIKTEETVVEAMDLDDPLVSGESSGVEMVAHVEDVLPYALV
ncbi:hypothetical protein pipiens_009249 [Culex pipiens pipiens]|uniref:ZAD domain-containing protein n=1 Tax=Culex pipiens pipiens TaxID=38569 RepID=A0ABD1DEV0_CULPP